MSGFGLQSFGLLSFGTVWPDALSIVRGTVPESQYVNSDGKFAFKSDGSFEGANNSTQRVQVLLATRMRQPMKIGPDFVADNESRVRAALSVLTSGTSPAIELQRVDVFDDGKRTTTTRVVFSDLLDGGRVKEVSL